MLYRITDTKIRDHINWSMISQFQISIEKPRLATNDYNILLKITAKLEDSLSSNWLNCSRLFSQLISGILVGKNSRIQPKSPFKKSQPAESSDSRHSCWSSFLESHEYLLGKVLSAHDQVYDQTAAKSHERMLQASLAAFTFSSTRYQMVLREKAFRLVHCSRDFRSANLRFDRVLRLKLLDNLEKNDYAGFCQFMFHSSRT